MKQTYEEEIHRLRRELESRGMPPASSAMVQDVRQTRPAAPGFPEGVPPPVLGNAMGSSGSGGVFGALMSGQGGPGNAGGPGGKIHRLRPLKVIITNAA